VEKGDVTGTDCRALKMTGWAIIIIRDRSFSVQEVDEKSRSEKE